MLNYSYIDPEEEIASSDFDHIESFLRYTGRLQIGWHYITDLTWMFHRFRQWPPGITVLDAGGGGGPLQFLLAEMGFNVVNIDLMLSPPPAKYRIRYGCRFKKLSSHKASSYANLFSSGRNFSQSTKSWKYLLRLFLGMLSPLSWTHINACRKWRLRKQLAVQVGKITWVAGNLCALPEIETNTFDAVVSLSALEHIAPPNLEAAINEINRIIKPGAKWALTTSGTEQSQTWLHEPSQGWCFSPDDLSRLFGEPQPGMAPPEQFLEKYRHCRYLKENLADFYKKSGKFGMPWGNWDPAYIPVGIASE